jgi:hypothetical protein
MNDSPVLTPAEWERVRAYDQLCADQIRQDREYAERTLKKSSSFESLLDALEAEAMEEIKDALEDIGLLMKHREAHKNNREVIDSTNVSLWMLRFKIEENHNDINRWRSYKKESCRV